MNLSRRYSEKAAKTDRLAEDPHLRVEMRAEMRSMARRWRHLSEQADWLSRRSGKRL
jgi:hypothetical protein